MNKRLGGLVLLAGLGGCVTSQPGAYMSEYRNQGALQATAGPMPSQGARLAATVPGAVGPWGQPVALDPAAVTRPADPAKEAARAEFARNVPPEILQQITYKEDARALAAATGGKAMLGPPALGGAPVPFGSPALPGPVPPIGSGLPGAVAAVGALTGGSAQPFPTMRTEVRFTGPADMKISWYAPSADGRSAGFSSDALLAPVRYNFVQGGIYRLKLSNIAGHPGLELYPTLEVVPANARTATFLAHSSVPLTFTNEDFEQVKANNYLVKVVYLPHPRFQDLANGVPDEVVSTRLEPGADPIEEALKRGSILLVVRMGNINLGLTNSPPLNAPNPYAPRMPAMPQGMMPPMMNPGLMPRAMGPMGPQGLPPGLMPPQGLPQQTPVIVPPQGLPQPPAPSVGPMGRAPLVDSPIQPVSFQMVPVSEVVKTPAETPKSEAKQAEEKPQEKKPAPWLPAFLRKETK